MQILRGIWLGGAFYLSVGLMWKSLTRGFCHFNVSLEVRILPSILFQAGVRNAYGSVSLKVCMDKGPGSS